MEEKVPKKSMKTKRGREFNEMHQTNLLSDGGVEENRE